MKKFLKLLIPLIIWTIQETECENQKDKGITLNSSLILTSTGLTLDPDVKTVDLFKPTSSEKKDSADINIVDQRTKTVKTQNKENNTHGIHKGDKNNFRSEVNKTGNGTKTIGIEKSEVDVKTLQDREVKAAALNDMIREDPKSRIQLQHGNFTRTAKKVKPRIVNVFDDTDTGVDDFDGIEEERQSLQKRDSDVMPRNDNSHKDFGKEFLAEQYYDFGFGIKIAPRVPFPDGRFEPPVLTDLSCWVCDWGNSDCMLTRCDSFLPYDGITSPKGYSCIHSEMEGGVLGRGSQMANCSYAESSFYSPCEELAKFTSIRNCRLCETDGCNPITSGSVLSKWLLALFFFLSLCSCCCLCCILHNRNSHCHKCCNVPSDGVAKREDYPSRESSRERASYSYHQGLESQGASDHGGDARRSHSHYGADRFLTAGSSRM